MNTSMNEADIQNAILPLISRGKMRESVESMEVGVMLTDNNDVGLFYSGFLLKDEELDRPWEDIDTIHIEPAKQAVIRYLERKGLNAELGQPFSSVKQVDAGFEVSLFFPVLEYPKVPV